MNNLSDEEIDKIIKEKFQKDEVIPDKVNAIFNNFNPHAINKENNKENNNEKNGNKVMYIVGQEESKQQNNYENEIKNKNKFQSQNIITNNGNNQSNATSNINNKLFSISFYKNLNKYLSVAAVSLTVVLVGGTTLYFNKNNNGSKSSNNTNPNTMVIQNYIIKNEELQFEKEQVLRESENEYVKVSLIGKREVAIQLKQSYIDYYNLKNVSEDKKYKVNNINNDIKDVFVGYTGNEKTPMVLLLMEDNTAEFVKVFNNDIAGYEYEFVSNGPVNGLYNIIGFMQGSRKFEKIDEYYYYISAIRKDGVSKAIEFYDYNDWDDQVDDVYERLNRLYNTQLEGIAGYANNYFNGGNYTNNQTYNNSVNKNITNNSNVVSNNTVNGRNNIVNNTANNTTNNNSNIVTNTTNNTISNTTNNTSNTINNSQNKNNTSNTTNQINTTNTTNTTNSVSNTTNTTNNTTSNNYSRSPNNKGPKNDFERKLVQSGDYYINSLGNYCIKTTKDSEYAYYLENNEMFRTNLGGNESYTWIASGVEDLYKDESGKIVAVLKNTYSIHEENDENIVFKEFNSTDSKNEVK